MFAMADALASRDSFRLWSLYRDAIDLGKVPEEIHGILFWQVKSLLMASRAETPGDAGLAPFVFTKAKRALSHFSNEDLTKMAKNLVSIYHDAHRGLCDFEAKLEIFTLSV